MTPLEPHQEKSVSEAAGQRRNLCSELVVSCNDLPARDATEITLKQGMFKGCTTGYFTEAPPPPSEGLNGVETLKDGVYSEPGGSYTPWTFS